MTGKGYAAKRTDGNHAEIVQDLRAAGYSVHSTHELGDGFPDIIVGVSVCHVWGTDLRQADIHKTINRNFLFEIKNPARPPSARKLTPDETFWHRDWAGQVDVIERAEDAVRIIETEMGR